MGDSWGETASDGLHDLLKDYDRKGELEDVIPLGLREAFDVEDDLGCGGDLFAVSCRICTLRNVNGRRMRDEVDAHATRTQEQNNDTARK